MADEEPTTEQQQTADPRGQSPLNVAGDEDPFAERPEAYVGAAFVGGLALAMIMRRFAR
jgi:hypothetical protein